MLATISAAEWAHLNYLLKVGNQGQWVLLPHPGYTVVEQFLLALATSDISQVGYKLQGVQGILLPRLQAAHV